jgi:hypothetical protein
MGTPAVGVAPVPVRFQRNLPFLNQAGSLGLEVRADAAPDVLAALRANGPFPAREIALAEIAARAESPKPIQFGSGSLKAEFAAGASAGIGVFQDKDAVLQKLAPDAAVLPGLDLEVGPSDNLLLLRWGFDGSANQSGAVALGAVGKATASVEAAANGLFAVVRRSPRTTPSRDALQDLADSWMLPRQVSSIHDMAPGTWLVAEVYGSLGVTLGVQAGWNFNWIREARAGALRGDIGLRLEAALSAKLGYRAEARWAVVVARETSDPEIRLRLFRLKARQLDFGLNAAVEFQPSFPILPRSADDLVRGVFGTHGAQVMGYLAIAEKWTNPTSKITELMASAGLDEAKELIAHVAGVPADQLDDRFNEVQQRVTGLVKAWRDLDHRAAVVLLKFVEEKVDLGPVKSLLGQLQTVDAPGLEKLLSERLKVADFLNTPVGRLLDALAGEGLLTLLARPLAEVHDVAAKALGLLDGSVIESSLGRLQDFLETQLDIKTVLGAVTETDFDKLDALLKGKLAEFLGKATIDFNELDLIRGEIHHVLDLRQEWYEKALRALERTWTAELAFTYQRSTTKEAHFDAVFDFRHDPQGVGDLLHDALSGNLDSVLTVPHRDVSLRLAQLTHGVKRRTHVEITLPYLHAFQTHVNQALATVEAKDDSGRVLVYGLDASDTVATHRRNSSLAVALSVTPPTLGPTLRRHQAEAFRYSYTLRQAAKRATRADLQAQLGPLFEEYLPQAPAAFFDYFDARTEEVIPETPDFLGDTMVNLQVSLSGEAARFAGAAWLDAPPSPAERLVRKQAMSEAIQNTMRRIVGQGYFQSADRFRDLASAQILLAWWSLRAFNEPGKVFWSHEVKARRSERLNEASTVLLLRNRLTAAHARLLATPGMSGLAQFYAPDAAAQLLGQIDPNHALLTGLLFGEAVIIRAAADAYDAIAELGPVAATQPSKAIEHLAEFGSKLTEAFNKSISDVYLGGSSRALGTVLFLEAAKALSGAPAEVQDVRPDAMLVISAMRSGAAFDPREFLENGTLPKELVAAQEVLASI